MNLNFSKEVTLARKQGAPIVALETSVLAQGLPYPRNLDAARQCETAIREGGAVPAAIAVIDGEIFVGIEADQTERLGRGESMMKLGSKDLSIAVARKASGGTTVSATCEVAAAAGIAVFSTGGLGGVHRGFEQYLDVSQDLMAVARFPVAVICAGMKSLLDLPRTLELLETLGVPVMGVGTRDMPGFYSQQSGLRLEHEVADAGEAAQIVRARLGLGQGGLIIAVPPPIETSMRKDEVEWHLAAALAAAEKQRVEGKSVTPFLLAEMARRTGGKSLEANLALLENNARFAAKVAVELERKESGGAVRADNGGKQKRAGKRG